MFHARLSRAASAVTAWLSSAESGSSTTVTPNCSAKASRTRSRARRPTACRRFPRADSYRLRARGGRALMMPAVSQRSRSCATALKGRSTATIASNSKPSFLIGLEADGGDRPPIDGHEIAPGIERGQTELLQRPHQARGRSGSGPETPRAPADRRRRVPNDAATAARSRDSLRRARGPARRSDAA